MVSDRDTVERRFRAHPALARRRLTLRKARDLLAGAYGARPPSLVAALGRCGKDVYLPADVLHQARHDAASYLLDCLERRGRPRHGGLLDPFAD